MCMVRVTGRRRRPIVQIQPTRQSRIQKCTTANYYHERNLQHSAPSELPIPQEKKMWNTIGLVWQLYGKIAWIVVCQYMCCFDTTQKNQKGNELGSYQRPLVWYRIRCAFLDYVLVGCVEGGDFVMFSLFHLPLFSVACSGIVTMLYCAGRDRYLRSTRL